MTSTMSVDEFWTLYEAGKLVFFAGSGISSGAGLPSAEQVMRQTLRAVLPSTSDDVAKPFMALQPEVFYEALIACPGIGDDALTIWETLHPDRHRPFGADASPSPCHRGLVRYAFKTGLPVFTTNFDLLFEQAATVEKIADAPVFTASDRTPEMTRGKAAVCKLHGSIADRNGLPCTSGLHATMTRISVMQEEWIGLIHNLMRDHHICFVGYSGRDIDYFPFIAEGARNGLRPVWINKTFTHDPAERAAARCGALRLEGSYPSELFATRLAINEPDRDGSTRARMTSALETRATELSSRLDHSVESERLVTSTLWSRLGQYQRSLDALSRDQLPVTQPALSYQLLLLSRLSHEVSKYRGAKQFAWRALKSSVGGGPLGFEPNTAIQALCLLAEGTRMAIPFDTRFDPPAWKLIGPSALSLIAFWLADMLFFLLSLVPGFEQRLTVATKQERLEHRIRWMSLFLGAFLTLRVPRVFWQVQRSAWRSLRHRCRLVGYAAGIANCEKFLARIGAHLPGDAEAGDEIFRMLTYSTGHELNLRTRGAGHLDRGEEGQAVTAFSDMRDQAMKSGNRLNEIKSILGEADVNIRARCRPILQPAVLARFDELVGALDEPRLIRHFIATRSRLT